MRWLRGTAMLAALGAAIGCAQVKTSSRVELVPKAQAPRVIGRPSGDVSDRSYEVSWLQRGREVIVEIHEHRRCQTLLHVPVVREEHITRKLDGTIYWEFGVLAISGTVGAWAFADPGSFGGVLINGQGDFVENKTGGYRVAGVFTGIAALTLTAIIIDFVRARDTVTYADAYQVKPGPHVDCEAPVLPVEGRELRIRLGDAEARGQTDETGRARILLPATIQFLDASNPTQPAGPGRGDRRPSALLIDQDHAVRIELRYPYPVAPETHTGYTPATPFEEIEPLDLGGNETP